MIRVFRRDRQLIGILENAYNITEQQRLNSVSAFFFTLPEDDHKNSLCEAFNYVNWDNGQLYRIMPSTHEIDELGGIIYECEHVIATLIDHIMFGQHVDGGVAGGHEANNTTAVIRRLLARQNQRYDPWTQIWTNDPLKPINWVLGTVEINRNFEYGWEQETILHALWSVATPFTEPYFWDFDTTQYPFVLHLRRLPTNPADALFIRQGKNLLNLIRQSDPTMLCTRIYPLGQGEGINQVNIRNVNNGVPFLQSPPAVINRYGIKERTWIDRRYTDEISLRDAAQAKLNELQEPYEEYQVDFEQLGGADVFRPWLGRMVDVTGFKRTWITGIDYNHDDLTVTKLSIANKPRDTAGSIADMADRQRIEMAYAQGATTFFTESENGNAMPNTPLLMELFIPHGLHIVNFIELNVTMNRFRIDSQATEGGGAIVNVQTAGGDTENRVATVQNNTASVQDNTATVQNSTATVQENTATVQNSTATVQDYTASVRDANASVIPWTSPELNIGGAAHTRTSWQGGLTTGWGNLIDNAGEPSHNHPLRVTHSHPDVRLTIPAGLFSHGHTGIPHGHTGIAHGHTGNPHGHTGIAHGHTGNPHGHTGIPHGHTGVSHGHTGIPHGHTGIAHNHAIPNMFINIPNHVHTMTPRMAFHTEQPTSFEIIINGVTRQTVTATHFNRDITDWLLDAQGRLLRGVYNRIEIRPNLPAHIRQMACVQGFVNSRGNRAL